jgi:hypothetical protein
MNRSLILLLLPLLLPIESQAGTLYLGTDNTIGSSGILGIYATNGAAVTSKTAVNPADGRSFNGVGEGLGLNGIVTGGWGHEFDTRNLAGNLISQSNNFFTPYPTVNEDFAGNGSQIWRVVYSPTIYLLNPDGTTNQAHTLSGASGLVGLTFVGRQLWAGDFNAGTIGTVNTTTDTYTPVFTPAGLTAEVGGLAYDAGSGVLWVGSQAVIAPFDLAGNRLGANIDTSGELGSAGFIDGLAFVPNSVPEPGSLTLLGLGVASFGSIAWTRKRKAKSVAI